MALRSFQLFLGQVENAPPELKVQVLKVVLDLLIMYDQEFFKSSEAIVSHLNSPSPAQPDANIISRHNKLQTSLSRRFRTKNTQPHKRSSALVFASSSWPVSLPSRVFSSRWPFSTSRRQRQITRNCDSASRTSSPSIRMRLQRTSIVSNP